MCKSPPGIRCTPHVSAKMKSVTKRLKAAQELVADAMTNADRISLDPDSTNEDKLRARSMAETALRNVMSIEDELLDVRRAYDSTPDGLKRLHDLAESEPSLVEKEKILARLELAKERREVQLLAGRMQAAADRRVARASEEETAAINALSDIAQSAEAKAANAYKSLSRASAEVSAARQSLDVALTDLGEKLADIKEAHGRIHADVKAAYMARGVSEVNAGHYADDTVASFQKGWQYVGPDSAEHRVPEFASSFQVKIKEEPSVDAVATALAVQDLRDDADFSSRFALVAESHARYQEQVQGVRAARAVLSDRVAEALHEKQVYVDLNGAARQAREEYVTRVATVASGLSETERYKVDAKTFVGSTYVNPDGSTNAYVRMQYGAEIAPYYVPVSRVERDKNGSYLVLQNGSTVYATAISGHSLLLTKPEPGSERLFAQKNQ